MKAEDCANKRKTKRRNERVANGFCRDCGTNEQMPGKSDFGAKQNSVAWYAKLVKLIENGEPFPRELQMLCYNCHFKKDLSPWWI